MGKQIHIQTSDLLKAGCKVEFTSEPFADEDDKGYFTQAKITLPDFSVFYMSYVNIDNTNILSNDYNYFETDKAS